MSSLPLLSRQLETAITKKINNNKIITDGDSPEKKLNEERKMPEEGNSTLESMIRDDNIQAET